MGMYDTVICKYPLPMPDDPKGYAGSDDFQTKDLDLALATYIIDENGQLFIHRFEGEWEPGNKDADSFIGKLGYYKTTKKWVEQLNTTMTVIFYDYQNSSDTDYDYFIEYEAVFINGKISSVNLIEFKANENEERKKRDLKFKKEMDEWFELKKTRKYKYFIGPYNKTIRFMFKNINKFLTSLPLAFWKLESKFLIK